MKNLIPENYFSDNYQNDHEIIMNREFLEILELLGEEKLLKIRCKINDSKNPAQLVYQIRSYLDCTPDIEIKFHEITDSEINIDVTNLLTQKRKQIPGSVLLENCGSYDYPRTFDMIETNCTQGVKISTIDNKNKNPLFYKYNIIFNKALLFEGVQEESIYFKIGNFNLTLPIRLNLISNQHSALLNQCKLIEELLTFSETIDLLFEDIVNSIQIDETFYENNLVLWFNKQKFDTSYIRVVLDVEKSERISILFTLLGLQEINEINKSRRFSRFHLLNEDESGWYLTKSKNGSKCTLFKKREGELLLEPDIKLKYYLSVKNDQIISMNNDINLGNSKESNLYLKAKLINILPIRGAQTLIATNRGVFFIRIFKKTIMIKRLWFRKSSFVDVFANSKIESLCVRYYFRKDDFNEFDTIKKVKYDWRKDYLKVCKIVRILYYSKHAINVNQKNSIIEKGVELCTNILTMMPYSTIATRAAIDSLFALKSTVIQNQIFAFEKTIKPILNKISFNDYFYAASKFAKIFISNRQLKAKWVQKNWLNLLENESKNIESEIYRRLKNPIVFFGEVHKNYELIKQMGPNVSQEYINMYTEIFESLKFEFDYIETIINKLFEQTSNKAFNLRMTPWMIIKSTQLANYYVNKLSPEEFAPIIFNEVFEILQKCDPILLQNNEIVKKMISWQSSLEKPDMTFFNFLAKTEYLNNEYVKIVNQPVNNIEFFHAFCRCQTINPSIALECEKRINLIEKIHDPIIILAMIKLSSLCYVHSEILEKNWDIKWPIAVRFCYYGKNADIYPKVIWPNNRGLFLCRGKITSVYSESLNSLLPACSFKINQRNILDKSVLNKISRTMDNSQELTNYLKLLTANDASYLLDNIHEYVYEIIEKICNNSRMKKNIIENIIEKIDWRVIANAYLLISKYYRPSFNLVTIKTILTYLDSSKDREIYSLLQEILIRIDSDSYIDSESNIENVNIHLQAQKIIEDYQNGNSLELDVRKIFTITILPQKLYHPTFIWACRKCFIDSGLYEPYGEYLVEMWLLNNLPDAILKEEKLVEQLIILTTNYDFKLSYYMQRDLYNSSCILVLAMAWEKYKGITPTMSLCLEQLIYRVGHKDTSMILDLLIEYYRLNPKKKLFLYEIVYQYKARKWDLPEKYYSEIHSLDYKKFINRFEILSSNSLV